ncbi:MAG: hypothetical protein ABL914_10980 [Novosphingobium sp.]|uniref:hypothetical protein n=1 Tax=Novosphingobium sp. TaxID=1874826 RepID=UPI0032BE3D85
MNSASTFGGELLRIAPSDIHIPKRLGLYFPDKAAALGRLMAVHGQRQPITVRRPLLVTDQDKNGVPHEGKSWVLVTGMHRLNGALLEELPHVFALERIGCFDTEALDEEASENLDRRAQPPLERAIFIHATCEAAKARLEQTHGTTSHGKLGAKARWDKVKGGEILPQQALQDEADDACGTMQQAYGWAESVAKAFGRDKSSIHRALKLYRMIIEPFPGLVQELSDHPIVGNNAAQLKAIAEIRDEAQRLAVIKQLLADPELSADDARVTVGLDKPAGPTPVAHQKFYNQIEGGWSRLGLPQRREFIDRIPALLGSDDMKRRLRDRLNEELGDAG